MSSIPKRVRDDAARKGLSSHIRRSINARGSPNRMMLQQISAQAAEKALMKQEQQRGYGLGKKKSKAKKSGAKKSKAKKSKAKKSGAKKSKAKKSGAKKSMKNSRSRK